MSARHDRAGRLTSGPRPQTPASHLEEFVNFTDALVAQTPSVVSNPTEDEQLPKKVAAALDALKNPPMSGPAMRNVGATTAHEVKSTR